MKQMIVILGVKSSELWSCLDFREKWTCKFSPPQVCVSFLCFPLHYYGGEKQICLDLHSWGEVIRGLQEKESPRNCFSNQISRPQEVFGCLPKFVVASLEAKVHCSLFCSLCYSIYFSVFICVQVLLFYFYLLASAYSWYPLSYSSDVFIYGSLFNSYIVWSFSDCVK